MADITADSPSVEAPAPEAPLPIAEVAPPAPDDLMHAVFDAVRSELELEETEEGGSDSEILADLRTVDKAVVSNAQGKPIITFEVGKEWPGLVGSKIIAMFADPIEGAMPGDLRVYVAPAAPLAGARDYLCMTFNRMSLGQAKEVMTRELFIRGVGSEFASLLDPDDDEDEEDDDDEEEHSVECGVDDCEAPPAYVCTCQVCSPAVAEAKFFACDKHRAHLDGDHLKENKRPAKWEKIPGEAEDS